jgi:hypothetical protein
MRSPSLSWPIRWVAACKERMKRPGRTDLLWYLLVLAACVPIFLALHVQVKHWVNIPIWDEWDTPGIAILRAAEHTLSWSNLFAQHNESRKVIPRLLCMALALPAGWDVRHAMILTFASVCLTSALVFVYLRRDRRAPVSLGVLFAWTIVNFLLFAPSQYENFLSGFVFEIFIPVLCLFGCIAVNLSQRRLPEKVAWNSVLALVATYTFAHGMLLWPLAVPIPRDDERSRRNWMWRAAPWYLVFLLIGTVSVACYFIGYKRPDIAPPPPKLSQAPQIIDFMIVWLGGVLRSTSVSARIAGTAVGVIFLLTTAVTLRLLYRKKVRWKSYYPWLVIGAFALGSGFVTAVGRVNIGVDFVFNTSFDGFSSMRYNATSVLAYVAIIGMLVNLHSDSIRFDLAWRSRWLIGTSILCTLLGMAWICVRSDERTRVPLFQQNRERARTAVIWNRVLPGNPEIFAAYPYPEGFSERVEEMKGLHLLKIPDVTERVAKMISSAPPPNGLVAGFIDNGKLEDGNKLRIAGWARNPTRNFKADYVVLGWEEPGGAFHPFTAIATGNRRPDVAQVFNSDSMEIAGFEQSLDISKLPRGPLEIKGWSIDLKNQEAFPMNGSVHVELPVLHSP